MLNTIRYLEEAMRILKTESQGQLAQRLGITRPAISQYMAGTRIMDDYTAARVAKVLGIDPLQVIAAANAEREKDSERRGFWLKLAGEAGAPPFCMFLIVMPFLFKGYMTIVSLMRNSARGGRGVGSGVKRTISVPCWPGSP
jgi:transcriptional regulator with XRE-family HTH domain